MRKLILPVLMFILVVFCKTKEGERTKFIIQIPVKTQ
jgi:hypothetical protein